MNAETVRNHDEAYVFGRHPSTRAPFPFTPRQFARLLVLQGRVQDTLEPFDIDGTLEYPQYGRFM